MDNIKFENKYEITIQLIRSWAKISQKRSAKHRLWISFFMKVWTAACAVACVPTALYYNDSTFTWFSLYFALIFIIILAKPTISAHKRIKQFTLQSGETTWIQSICFGENMEIKNCNSTTVFSYDRIRFIDENEECYYLWVGVNLIFIIYKNAFSVGNADEFPAFIKEKCAEQAPLWDKRELNERVLKKTLPRIIVMAVLVVVVHLCLWVI